MPRKNSEGEQEKIYFKVGDEVWRKGGYFYQRSTITAIDGDKVILGNKEALVDDLLPDSIFAVPDEIRGLTYDTHIYDYLVFRTYTSNRVTDMGNREKAEGLYVEKPVCETYRRQHFPDHPTGKAAVLRLLAHLEEQA
jgi:hypothetical protein